MCQVVSEEISPETSRELSAALQNSDSACNAEYLTRHSAGESEAQPLLLVRLFSSRLHKEINPYQQNNAFVGEVYSN